MLHHQIYILYQEKSSQTSSVLFWHVPKNTHEKLHTFVDDDFAQVSFWIFLWFISKELQGKGGQ